MKIRYLIGIVLVLMLLISISGCKKQEVVEEEIEPEPEEGQLQEVEVSPEEVEKCGVDTVLTYRKCEKLANDKVSVSFINSGRGEIEGVWFYVKSEDGTEGYEEVREIIGVKEI